MSINLRKHFILCIRLLVNTHSPNSFNIVLFLMKIAFAILFSFFPEPFISSSITPCVNTKSFFFTIHIITLLIKKYYSFTFISNMSILLNQHSFSTKFVICPCSYINSSISQLIFTKSIELVIVPFSLIKAFVSPNIFSLALSNII